MSWARFDDNFPQHPKVVALSDRAFRLHVAAICYASRLKTNGEISEAVAHNLVPMPKAKCAAAIGELVTVGLWDETQGGYSIHDYLHYNPSKERTDLQAKERYAIKSRAGKAGAAKRWQRGDRDNGTCYPSANGSANGSAIAHDSPLPLPLPLPKVPTELKPPSPPVRLTAVDEGFVEQMVTEFSPRLGGVERTREIITEAMNHKAADKAKDKRIYLRGWLRRETERVPTRPTNGRITANPINEMDKWQREAAWNGQSS